MPAERRGTVEIAGIGRICVSVSGPVRSEGFYDAALPVLGLRKNALLIGRQHDPCVPGLHHPCLRVDSIGAVTDAYRGLSAAGIAVTEPRCYPEYAHDDFAIFFSDPDGLRLEVTHYREERRRRAEARDRGE